MVNTIHLPDSEQFRTRTRVERTRQISPGGVLGEALDQVLGEDAAGPGPELDPAASAHPVADGEDRIEVVVVDAATDRPVALGANLQEFLAGSIPGQRTFVVEVQQASSSGHGCHAAGTSVPASAASTTSCCMFAMTNSAPMNSSHSTAHTSQTRTLVRRYMVTTATNSRRNPAGTK